LDKSELPSYQCVLCGWLRENVEKPPEKCEECGCTLIREIHEGEPIDHVTPDSVAHLKKRVERCWNYSVVQGAPSYHPLVLDTKLEKTVRGGLAFVKITKKCKTCGTPYGVGTVPLTRVDVLDRLGITEQVNKL
jgi:rubredoxin